MRFEVAPLPLDVVVCFFLWTGIVPSLWEFVWNVSRNGICLYYYLVYPSLGRLYFTHNSGWHLTLLTQNLLLLQYCLFLNKSTSLVFWSSLILISMHLKERVFPVQMSYTPILMTLRQCSSNLQHLRKCLVSSALKTKSSSLSKILVKTCGRYCLGAAYLLATYAGFPHKMAIL